MMNRMTFALIIMLSSICCFASIQVYKFDDTKKEQQFNMLVQELRCPKCQNNNLADSNSDLSVDLKGIIYEKVIAGESNDQIVDYLKARYGDFISYRPPVKPSTWLIWFGPFVFLAIGAFAILRFLSSREVSTINEASNNVSQASKDLLGEWSDEVVDNIDTKQGEVEK